MLSDYHDMLSHYDSWKQAGDNLQMQVRGAFEPRYGDDMRTWLLDMQPQVVDFISSGARAGTQR